MEFFLGTHHPNWLKRLDIPLFVSRRRLDKIKTLPRALAPWALDSGGFSELSLFGEWTITPEQYVEEVRRFSEEIGNLRWAAVMDWMCEPFIREGGKMAGGADAPGTGLSVEEHQKRTVQNVLDLMDLDPDIPWAPVLQGWEIHEYYEHYDMYDAAGIDLKAFPVLGIGSVCRRGHTDEIVQMMHDLARDGLKLHGFGLKKRGLQKAGESLASADSMAWSYQARRRDPLPECVKRKEQGLERGHKNCANCVYYAMKWRQALLDSLDGNGTGEHVAKKKTVKAEVMERKDVCRLRVKELIAGIGYQYFELGEHLYEVEAGEYYLEWGFASFDEYCEIEVGFKRTKAKYVLRIWEKLSQRLGIPWEDENPKQLQLQNIQWSKVCAVVSMIEDIKDARKWLKLAARRTRTELTELVRIEKARRNPEPEANPSRQLEDQDMSAELDQAAATETPFVETPIVGDDEDDEDEFSAEDDGFLAEEFDEEDEETGETVRLFRLSFVTDREEYAHIQAAFERMAQITGERHPGRLLDLMAAEINETLADKSVGGAAHRLDWYVKNLERIFDVQMDVTIPKHSKLRDMSRV